eukprot:1150113-Pelagomonas_calceolata.AAC.9
MQAVSSATDGCKGRSSNPSASEIVHVMPFLTQGRPTFLRVPTHWFNLLALHTVHSLRSPCTVASTGLPYAVSSPSAFSGYSFTVVHCLASTLPCSAHWYVRPVEQPWCDQGLCWYRGWCLGHIQHGLAARVWHPACSLLCAALHVCLPDCSCGGAVLRLLRHDALSRSGHSGSTIFRAQRKYSFDKSGEACMLWSVLERFTRGSIHEHSLSCQHAQDPCNLVTSNLLRQCLAALQPAGAILSWKLRPLHHDAPLAQLTLPMPPLFLNPRCPARLGSNDPGLLGQPVWLHHPLRIRSSSRVLRLWLHVVARGALELLSGHCTTLPDSDGCLVEQGLRSKHPRMTAVARSIHLSLPHLHKTHLIFVGCACKHAYIRAACARLGAWCVQVGGPQRPAGYDPVGWSGHACMEDARMVVRSNRGLTQELMT